MQESLASLPSPSNFALMRKTFARMPSIFTHDALHQFANSTFAKFQFPVNQDSSERTTEAVELGKRFLKDSEYGRFGKINRRQADLFAVLLGNLYRFAGELSEALDCYQKGFSDTSPRLNDVDIGSLACVSLSRAIVNRDRFEMAFPQESRKFLRLIPRKRVDVILSYAWRDGNEADQLLHRLLARGLTVWCDNDDLKPGAKWLEEIEILYLRSSAIILCFGEQTNPEWRLAEKGLAFERFYRYVGPRDKIIPVLVGNVTHQAAEPLPDLLRSLNWLDMRGWITEQQVDKLVGAIRGYRPRTGRMSQSERSEDITNQGPEFVDATGINQNPKYIETTSDQDKQLFVSKAFESIVEHFRNSAVQFSSQEPRVSQEFERVDKRKFVLTLFGDGQEKHQCQIWIDSDFSRVPNINFFNGRNISDNYNARNEIITAIDTDEGLKLKGSIGSFSGGNIDACSPMQAAELLWHRFIRGISSDFVKMNSDEIDQYLVAGAELLLLDSNIIAERAYAAADQAGFAAGAASAGIYDRLKKFYDEYVLPAYAKTKESFDEHCSSVEAAIRNRGLSYLARLSSEEFSGIETQKLIVLAATTDALRKMLPGLLQGEFDFSSFSITEWTLIALGFLMYRDSLKESKGQDD